MAARGAEQCPCRPQYRHARQVLPPKKAPPASGRATCLHAVTLVTAWNLGISAKSPPNQPFYFQPSIPRLFGKLSGVAHTRGRPAIGNAHTNAFDCLQILSNGFTSDRILREQHGRNGLVEPANKCGHWTEAPRRHRRRQQAHYSRDIAPKNWLRSGNAPLMANGSKKFSMEKNG